MLQLGWISRRGPSGPERESRFTPDEQITHFTLWCIAQSPLMMGGDMPDNSPFVESLLTNDEVLAVNQRAYDAKQLFRKDNQVVWTSKIPGSTDVYVAFFNLGGETAQVAVDLAALGIKGKVTVRDLWEKKELGIFSKSYSANVNSHGAKLFRFSIK
jgi:hypothetical protein